MLIILVPSYCLQYYNASTGVVRSFDWPRQQQSIQQYTVCVEGSEQSKFVTVRDLKISQVMIDKCLISVLIFSGDPALLQMEELQQLGDALFG